MLLTSRRFQTASTAQPKGRHVDITALVGIGSYCEGFVPDADYSIGTDGLIERLLRR